MRTSFTFKNLDPSDSLKTYATEKLDRFDKYLDNPAEANVVLSVEKFRHTAEINITGDRLSITGKEETGDMYSAIDKVLDKVGKQIKKSKGKIRSRRTSRSRQKGEGAMADFSDEPQLFVETIDYKPMDVNEAMEQMELTEDAFFVFTNAKTDRVNVLYRRNDGNIGLIEPSA